MRKPKRRYVEVLLVIAIFLIVFLTAIGPYRQYQFMRDHPRPVAGMSKEKVIRLHGMPTGEMNSLPVIPRDQNREAIDSLKDASVSYFLYWRRKVDFLETFHDLRKTPTYSTFVVAFDEQDKVITGFHGVSYAPDRSPVQDVRLQTDGIGHR